MDFYEYRYNDVEEYLKNNTKTINDKNNYGLSRLVIASWFGYDHIVDLLLTYKDIDVNIFIKENSGNGNDEGVPLTYALRQKNIYIATKLLEHKDIDIEIIDCYQKKPIHYALELGNKEIIKKLKEKEININEVDDNGNTFLINLIHKADDKTIEILLNLYEDNFKLDTKIKNKNKKSALNIAREYYDSDLIYSYIDYSYDINGETDYYDLSYEYTNIIGLIKKYQKKKNKYYDKILNLLENKINIDILNLISCYLKGINSLYKKN